MPVQIIDALKDFVKRETTGGFMLFGAAVAALIAMNSPLAAAYFDLLQSQVAVRAGAFEIAKPLQLWVNDGLMAVFFFLIGLEVKREVVEGELSSLDKATLPIMAAIGGMLVPALVFVAVNWSEPGNLRGWAIPAATDIAFALGILALLGTNAPPGLKILLLAIAIIDDIGAITIIALFYTAEVSVPPLAWAGAVVAGLVFMNRLGVTRTLPYVLAAVVLWVLVLKSGVHATLAGVLAAFAVPLTSRSNGSPLKRMEHSLHPWVAFMVLPIFAFANAGVSLREFEMNDAFASLPLGIALGLLAGKQLGVFGFMALAIKTGLARRPADISWRQLYGLACVTGIGFTMSFLIGALAYADPGQMEQVKVGVILGSTIAALLGFAVLWLSKPTAKARAEPRHTASA